MKAAVATVRVKLRPAGGARMYNNGMYRFVEGAARVSSASLFWGRVGARARARREPGVRAQLLFLVTEPAEHRVSGSNTCH